MNKKIIVLLNLSIIVFIVGIFTWRFWSKKPTPTIEIPPDLEIVLTTKGTYYPRETILQIKADVRYITKIDFMPVRKA